MPGLTLPAREVIEVKSGNGRTINKAKGNVNVRDKAYIGLGRPGVPPLGRANGVFVNGPADLVTIANCSADNLNYGFTVQNRDNDEYIKQFDFSDIEVRNMFDFLNGIKAGRSQGCYGWRIHTMNALRIYMERVGFEVGDPRETYSWHFYINEILNFNIKDAVLNEASAGCLNIASMAKITCENVICANSPMHFNFAAKQLTKPLVRCYSIAVSKEPIADEKGVYDDRGWHMKDNQQPPKELVILDVDPVDWAVVDQAKSEDKFPTAEEFILRHLSGHTPVPPRDKPLPVFTGPSELVGTVPGWNAYWGVANLHVRQVSASIARKDQTERDTIHNVLDPSGESITMVFDETDTAIEKIVFTAEPGTPRAVDHVVDVQLKKKVEEPSTLDKAKAIINAAAQEINKL